MSRRSIEYVREWLGEEGAESPNEEIVDHIRAVLSIADRAIRTAAAASKTHDQTFEEEVLQSMNEFTESLKSPTQESMSKEEPASSSDRYHYALGQLEKAREFLEHGRAAAAMDALHRAMDGIIEE